MNIIFTARHWQIFLFFLSLSFLQSMSNGLYCSLDAFFYSLYIVTYIGWLLVLGTRLRRFAPSPSKNYRLFLATGLALIIVVISFRFFIVFELLDLRNAVLVMLGYIIVSLCIVTSFVAKNLKILEVGNDIDINDYFGDMLGLIFWPIGIWRFQPRVNRVYQRLRTEL